MAARTRSSQAERRARVKAFGFKSYRDYLKQRHKVPDLAKIAGSTTELRAGVLALALGLRRMPGTKGSERRGRWASDFFGGIRSTGGDANRAADAIGSPKRRRK